MRYNKIRKMDISNGPGVRVSIFFQGCSFHCNGCFNPETWDFNTGLEFNDSVIDTIIDLCKEDHITGLSLLGGIGIVGGIIFLIGMVEGFVNPEKCND